jgi:hypothetical protein
MFKWLCLAVAAAFLAVATWMLNDIRLQVRQSSAVVRCGRFLDLSYYAPYH